MIRDPALTEAHKLIREAKKAREAARPKRVVPTAEGQRQPRVQEPGFLAFLRRQPCSVAHLGGCSGPIEAAHIRYSDFRYGIVNPGMQRKPSDRYATSLCAAHHREGPKAQHGTSEWAWWANAGIDAYALAAEMHRRYVGEG